MQITYCYFSQQGKRANNEDYVLCRPDVGIFVLCDGVGGANKGEVASQMVCHAMVNYFSTSDKFFNEIEVVNALREAEKNLSEYVIENPASEGMATTLTFLGLSKDALIAHVGDSRVYYIRDGEILYKTSDHSYVNELMASGFITEEAARVHPKKNIITRAVQGVEASTEPDFAIVKNLKKNDYFFLCSDGVLESIDDAFIQDNFKDNSSVDSIIQKIKELCLENSLDNNSAILIKITERN